MSVSEKDWEWFGSAGHLIVSDRCRFHLLTLVGNHIVSTVGEWFESDRAKKPSEIGLYRLYETMVFNWAGERCKDCDCGAPRPTTFDSIDSDGYNTPGDATKGHMALCQKYARSARERRFAAPLGGE